MAGPARQKLPRHGGPRRDGGRGCPPAAGTPSAVPPAKGPVRNQLRAQAARPLVEMKKSTDATDGAEVKALPSHSQLQQIVGAVRSLRAARRAPGAGPAARNGRHSEERRARANMEMAMQGSGLSFESLESSGLLDSEGEEEEAPACRRRSSSSSSSEGTRSPSGFNSDSEAGEQGWVSQVISASEPFAPKPSFTFERDPGRVEVEVRLTRELEVVRATRMFQAFCGPLQSDDPLTDWLEPIAPFLDWITDLAMDIVAERIALPLHRVFGPVDVRGSSQLQYSSVVVALFPELEDHSKSFQEEFMRGAYRVSLLFVSPGEDAQAAAASVWKHRQKRRERKRGQGPGPSGSLGLKMSL